MDPLIAQAAPEDPVPPGHTEPSLGGATAPEVPPEPVASPPVRSPLPEASGLTTFCRGLGLLSAELASLFFAVWYARLGDGRVPLAIGNVIKKTARAFAFYNIAAAIGVAVLFAFALLVWKRGAAPALLERIGTRLAPLLLAGLVPPLLEARAYAGHELTWITLAAVFAFGLRGSLRLAFATGPVLRLPDRWRVTPALRRALALASDPVHALARRPGLAIVPVLLGVAGYGLFFSHHTLNTHYRIGTASFDLGIENNVVWNVLHGGPFFKTSPLGGPTATHAGFHQTYFAWVIALFYRFSPRPETLLIFQSFFIAAAAIPLYVFARRRIGAWSAALVAILYLLYPPVHGSNLYDFHYQPLSVFFLFATVAVLEGRRAWLAIPVVLLGYSCREDIPALMAVLGAFLVLTGSRPRAGLVLTVASLAAFGVLKFAIMPRFLGGTEAYIHQYQELIGTDEKGFGGVLKTVIGNPFFTAGKLLERDKLVYFLQMLVPLAFVPFRRPIGYLLAVPGFFFTLCSTQYPPLVQISFQYTAYWTPFMFIAAVVALQWTERSRPHEGADEPGPTARKRALLFAMAGAMVVCTVVYGAFVNTINVKGGFGPYRFGLTDRDHERHKNAYALIRKVPRNAKVVASELVVPHLSSRADAYTLRTGLFDAEYLVLETPVIPLEANFAREALRDRDFGVVEVRGEFVLAKRGHDQAKNAEVLATTGL